VASVSVLNYPTTVLLAWHLWERLRWGNQNTYHCMARLYFLLFLSPIHLCTHELEEYKWLIWKGVSLFPGSQNATPFHNGRKDPRSFTC